jgi:hypothetical protein
VGLAAKCRARHGGKTATGEALLEDKEIVFRGEVRFRVALADLRVVEARAGALHLETKDGVETVLALGDLSARWAEKILHPPSLLDKLGVKPGARVSVVGAFEAEFLELLASRTDDVTVGRARAGSHVVLVAMSSRAELPPLRKLRGAIAPGGAVWVVWPKGRQEFREDDVRAYGPKAGLVDVKVARFSDALSALKMVIPMALRAKAGPRPPRPGSR